MANSYLSRTPSSASNRKTFTISAWIKRSKLGTDQKIFAGGSPNSWISFETDDQFTFNIQNSGDTTTITTDRVFRDTSSWYHIVCAVDTTQATNTNRVKIYVNGVQETSLSATTYPDQNDDSGFNNTGLHTVGRLNYASSGFFEGYISHLSFVDGAALTPTTFGGTDSTSGIWKFKAPSGVTWGTNGFHLKFENSGNLGLDSSGNSNTWTVNGNLKQALDTPSNVYANWNPLVKSQAQPTFENGNTTVKSSANSWRQSQSTLGVTKGKWYFECKNVVGNSMIGVSRPDINPNTAIPMNNNGTTFFYNQDGGEMRKDSVDTTANYGTFSTSDIMGVAFDMDNKTITIYKNNSAIVTNYPVSTHIDDVAVMNINVYTSGEFVYTNFGNGYFGSTAITSAGSNGNGSLFEYDVPSGHYALNTKNINTYG